MSQHPYSASVPASEQHDLQQSLFPSWHNRRHSHTTDMILEEGQRKSGSFEALQDMVKKHQSQQDDSDDDDEKHKEDAHVKATTDKSNKGTPPGPSILIQEPDQDGAAGDKKQPKLRRSVKFDAGEDDGSNFIKN
ncbi:hypothetical protein HMPREF1544_04470 [Mucor circinelloides 1006PhL]|uniref:Uncharacterized protein n=1 Tax=Mucor circinelloides f. circinelloides (strain 1006PhL) TaxID=1220926 RepID=S2JEI2_MUCC1|nr:hypothetical protein HMPREF1544_04470 [Mucor circinelloides 1006PhL]KAG1093726.1 hypothetical protein G6F42_018899 [Rhizopus arrhizus]